MNDNLYTSTSKLGKRKVMAGLFLMAIGAIVLVNQLNFWFLPVWPILIIALGAYLGAKCNFRKPMWILIMAFGFYRLIQDLFPELNIGHFFWPLFLIGFGIRLIVSRNQVTQRPFWSRRRKGFMADDLNVNATAETAEPAAAAADPNTQPTDFAQEQPNFTQTGWGNIYNRAPLGEDYLEAVCIFSGIKKKILSKQFKGGEITNIFGGCDIDFSSADIEGKVYIDVTQVFGGIKLIVPPHWQVTSDIAALFAGVDDKRMHRTDFGSDKILVLKGLSIFAGVEIKNF